MSLNIKCAIPHPTPSNYMKKVNRSKLACKCGPLKYVTYSGPWYTGLGKTTVCTIT